MKRTIVATGAVALAVGGGGAAVAASGFGTPAEESKAVIEDAAEQLGVESSELSAALKQAVENRIDAALAAGRITQAQAEAMKERLESEDFPLLAGPGFRHHDGPRIFGHLEAAASYLGLSRAELRTELGTGKTLADVAEAEGKSVDGLVAALVADEKEELDAAVEAGRLTRAQADELLANAEERFTDLVSGTLPERGRHRFGGPGFFPPPGSSDA
jgi:hypothetical protein